MELGDWSWEFGDGPALERRWRERRAVPAMLEFVSRRASQRVFEIWVS